MVANLKFGNASPYRNTSIVGRFAGYYKHRSVGPDSDDMVVKVIPRWNNRPDLMAFDLYGDPDLFIVIALRNVLQDPIYDVIEGNDLIVPSLERAKQVTGIN